MIPDELRGGFLGELYRMLQSVPQVLRERE
jgi:hypothetical protein